jgi:hypothetical protein
MATHKVPQDVEAEDKLVGFLSLRQFIMVLVGLGFGYLTFFFFTRIHPITALIWIPPTVVCLVLGLYQRKDQPVEVYLASALRFYFKPRKRKWDQEGYEERVIITAPERIQKQYTKNFTGEEAYSRLDNLSRLMDSRGWTSKLIGDWQNPQLASAAAGDRLVQPGSASMPQTQQDFVQPIDMMDEATSRVAQNFESRIQQTDTATHQQAIQAMHSARQPAGQAQTSTVTAVPTYKKYPEMRQKVVQPSQPIPASQQLNNQKLQELSKADDLNIQALAAEAKHIANNEVEVSLH